MKRSMTFFLSLICATAMMAAPVAMAAETETETAVTEMVSEAETETGSETETEAEGVLAPTPQSLIRTAPCSMSMRQMTEKAF